VIAGAPAANRLILFEMMARDACTYADAVRQQVIDDLQLVAAELGLIDIVAVQRDARFPAGAISVQEVLANAFGGRHDPA
jgi:hypothetical protein